MEFRQWVDNELSEQIWKDKYQHNGETFDEWLDRVSNGNEKVKQLILNKKFLFAGRILASRGLANERKVTYSNCYVLEPVEDSIEGIYGTAAKLARTFSYGGGCGIDISQLRPKGSPVNNAAKTTSGAVSFMETFSHVSEVIGQKGRRGALMISMDCHHADVADFIDAKKNTDKLNGCNISVRCDDNFMQQANVKGSKEQELFMKLAQNNWDYAEPGILYWDTINNYNLLSEYVKDGTFKFAGVNPCAEEPLPSGGSCLLGAINLAEFVEDEFTDYATFNLVDFMHTVKEAVFALNDVLDEGLELHPLEEQRQSVAKWRQIGLGIMGFGDMLIKMKVAYGSEKSLQLIQFIGSTLVDQGLYASAVLAGQRGPFEAYDFDKIKNSTFIQNLDISEETLGFIELNGLRNSQLFTIAPTGSIGTMLGVSTGVEPIFNYAYTRTTKSLNGGVDTQYKVVTPIVLEALKAENVNSTNVDDVGLPNYIVWAGIIDPYDRLKVQAQWQRFIDASISSTVNLAEEVSVEQVADIYYKAWQYGCKGITIFRDNCARTAILSTNVEKPKEITPEEVMLKRGEWAPIPEDTIYVKRKVYTGCGEVNLFIGWSPSEQRLTELYVKRSANGGCEHNIDAVVICMSGMLRLGGNIYNIEKAFGGCGACNSFTRAKCKGQKLSPGKSCPTAILNMIKATEKELKEGKVTVQQSFMPIDLSMKPKQQKPSEVPCPDCGKPMANTGGCNICLNCGYSKCE